MTIRTHEKLVYSTRWAEQPATPIKAEPAQPTCCIRFTPAHEKRLAALSRRVGVSGFLKREARVSA